VDHSQYDRQDDRQRTLDEYMIDSSAFRNYDRTTGISGLFILPVYVGNTEKLKEMLLSIPLHMQNIHEFPENKHYKVCI
jgi:hypothetical protein